MWRRFVESFRAWLRDERRVAPAGVRGRVYARKDGAAGGIATRTKLKPSMKLRIFRAATGQWEQGPTIKGE